MRALEPCYGSDGPCAVSLTLATEPHPKAADGYGWGVPPPPGTLALAGVSRLGYVIRHGVYVTLLAQNRTQLIAAAEALRPIP